jgi:hypothetical protein
LKTPSRFAPFERRETLGRWKESLGTPVVCFFGGEQRKGAKGRKQGEVSSNIQRKKTWETQKLKRAEATLSSLTMKESAEGTAGLVG